jgi:hypothetical protein
MLKKLTITACLIAIQFTLFAQFGSIAVFEKNESMEITKIRIYPNTSNGQSIMGKSEQILKSVNKYFKFDGIKKYAAFWIPFTGFEGARDFAKKEYLSKKERKSVVFVNELTKIVLDADGNVANAEVVQKPLGTMVIYYGGYSTTAGRLVINSAYCYQIFGEPGFNAKELATTLKSKVLGSTDWDYEWNPGMSFEQVKKKIGPGITVYDNGEYRR